MAKKTNPKRPIHKTFLFNLGVIILICLALYGALVFSLGWYTHHGESVAIPNLIGKNINNVQNLIRPNNFKLNLDSTYQPDAAPLTIIKQKPTPDFRVKKGHTIIVTVNKRHAPEIPMPDLINLSFRSAKMVLKSNKLIMGKKTLKPDLAKNAVLEQRYQGDTIKPGTLIPQGATINLVVGNGIGIKKMNVPNVVGMTFMEASALLSGSNLNYFTYFDGGIQDTLSAVVYQQNPPPINTNTQEHNTIEEGMNIVIHVRQEADGTRD